MRVIECEQGTAEWHAARCGRVTGSRISDVLRKGRTKGEMSKSRITYALELIAERLTGIQDEGFTSRAMQWGKDNEPKAAKLYEFINGESCQKVGMVLHPTIDYAAASPDRLVGENGLAEFKCPDTKQHLYYCFGGLSAIDSDYLDQMQWQMTCTGRQWCDFVSFDPRLAASQLPDLQINIVRVERDPVWIANANKEVAKFISEVQAAMDFMSKKKQAA